MNPHHNHVKLHEPSFPTIEGPASVGGGNVPFFSNSPNSAQKRRQECFLEGKLDNFHYPPKGSGSPELSILGGPHFQYTLPKLLTWLTFN